MSTRNAGRWLAIAASVVVVATLIGAMLVIGSPASQRESRFDRKREQDLGRIERAIETRVDSGKPLPASLAELASEPGQRLAVRDPQTHAPYGYEIAGNERYRLCAVFTTDTARESGRGWIDQAWLHGQGRHCFDRKLERGKD